MVCNKNCFECPFPDCINDEVDLLDECELNKIDKSIIGRVIKNPRVYRYNHSVKGKNCKKRYYATEKGKENRRKSVKKSYSRHRELRLMYQKRYYQEHADEINEKRRLYYAKNRDAILEKAKQRRQQKKQEAC